MRVHKFAGVGLFLLVIGCGASKLEQQNQVSQAAMQELPSVKLTREVLIGNWMAPCHLETKSDTYVVEYLEFDLDETNHLTTFYLDAACTQAQALYQQSVKSTYVFGSQGSYTETREQIAVMPESSTALALFSPYEGFCGSQEWKVHEEQLLKDVTKCGMQKVMTSTLHARGSEHKTELVMKECPSNSSECHTSVYVRKAAVR